MVRTNAVESNCDEEECLYWKAIHGIDGCFINQERFKKCSMCTLPTREKMNGQGIYRAEG